MLGNEVTGRCWPIDHHQNEEMNPCIKAVTESCCYSYSEFRHKLQVLTDDKEDNLNSNLVNGDGWEINTGFGEA